MSEHDFCQWLQGYLDARDEDGLEDLATIAAKLREVKPGWQLDPNMFRVHRNDDPPILLCTSESIQIKDEPEITPGVWMNDNTIYTSIQDTPLNYVPGTCGPIAPIFGPTMKKGGPVKHTTWLNGGPLGPEDRGVEA
jgi:hypothetical protein